jgi:hypothetical protein
MGWRFSRHFWVCCDAQRLSSIRVCALSQGWSHLWLQTNKVQLYNGRLQMHSYVLFRQTFEWFKTLFYVVLGKPKESSKWLATEGLPHCPFLYNGVWGTLRSLCEFTRRTAPCSLQLLYNLCIDREEYYYRCFFNDRRFFLSDGNGAPSLRIRL